MALPYLPCRLEGLVHPYDPATGLSLTSFQAGSTLTLTLQPGSSSELTSRAGVGGELTSEHLHN